MKAVLLESTEIAPEVRHFVLEVPEVASFDFVPGQFVSLSEEIRDKKIVRAYSIVSEPDGTNRFALCLNRVEQGHMSPWLFDRRPGDVIEVKPALGMFTLRPNGRDALLIATGTGIAPYRSMLRAELGKARRKFTLIFGTRYESTLLYGSELAEMERAHPEHLRFWPTLSRPEAGWSGRTGYVQTHIEEAAGDRRDFDVFICGLKLMVDEVRDRLKLMGFDRKQIVYEKYD